MANEGIFIAFEGGEGSGKTTQIKKLAQYLEEHGYGVVETKEPGGTPVGMAIRNILLDPESKSTLLLNPEAESEFFVYPDQRLARAKTEVMLFYADRAQHLAEVIKPALEAGKAVLTDRYFYSTLAYQHFGRGIPREEIMPIHRFVVDLLPHLVILLDIDPEVGLARNIDTDKRDRFESEELEFHKKVNEGFRRLAAEDKERFLIVDASLPPDKIFAAVKERVITALGIA